MSSKSFIVNIDHKIRSFKKVIKVDSDKSISIRSFLIGAISQNISHAKNVLESEDVYSAIECLKKLGVKIKKNKKKDYTIYGKGLGSLFAKKNTILNFGNSGTLARLLIGILSTTPNIELNIRGDHSLNKFQFPLKIVSTELPIAINYRAGVSAQLKSAVILAGLNSYGTTTIFENEKSRDHTENILKLITNAIKIKKDKKKFILIEGKKTLNPLNIKVPGDPSSAAFFVALTLLKENSLLKINDVGLNPTRTGFYQILKKGGASINFFKVKKENNENVGNILVRSSKLKPLKVSRKYYVNSTDEYPILFVIAGLTEGVSTFNGINDLANKESNRIKEMQNVLRQVGIKSISSKDKLKIYGRGMIDASNKKIVVRNLGDHRICMSSFILAILTGAKTKIKNFETVYTSSPSFLKIVKNLGARFEIQK